VRPLGFGLGEVGVGFARGTHQRLELRRGQRRAEVKALILIAAECFQELELLGGLDALRHDL